MYKFVAVILLLTIALAGCSQSPKNGASSSQAQDPNRQVKVQQTAPQKTAIRNPQAVAERLEQIASSVPNVQSANCVVFGNTAIVGINVPPDMDRSHVGTVKLAVAEALKKDPFGADAFVTADIDMSERLRKIRNRVQAGQGFSGLADEMAAIIGRIIPQIPRDVNPLYNQAPNASPQIPGKSM